MRTTLPLTFVALSVLVEPVVGAEFGEEACVMLLHGFQFSDSPCSRPQL